MFASKSSPNKPENSFQATPNCHNVHAISYVELLAVSNDVSVHEKHFCISVYKSLVKTNSDFMWDFYAIKPVPYELCAGEKLYLPTINTTKDVMT